MLGLIMKIIVCPLIIYISDMVFNDIYYANTYQAIITGLVIAFIGHMMEVLILKKGTLWISTFADLVAAIAVVYLSQFFLPGSRITIAGAAIIAVILAITEHFQHIYLIKEGKTKKTD